MTHRTDVQFPSGESFASGWFFTPTQPSADEALPAVAMAHGLGGVKEMYLEPYARQFADVGIATLLFDYRGFGSSGGEPRQRIFPRDQIEDYRSALTWLSLQPQIDPARLGVWGTSFSGGHVLHVAAYDPRVKAVVSQAGAMDVYLNLRDQIGPNRLAALQDLTTKERRRRALEGGEIYIQKVGRPGELALQTDQDSYDFSIEAHATVAPAWRNEATMSSLEAILEYAPVRTIDLIAPKPLLLILAKDDITAPPATIRAAYAAAGEPKRLEEVDGKHYSVYRGPSADKAARLASDWFSAHL